jgi:hypothetical protein
MSSIVVAGDTSGSVTLQAPAVAGSTVLTLPAVSGTVLTSTSPQSSFPPNIAGNGPAFSAYANATTSISSTTWTKLSINVITFDTNSNYNTTLYRFLPTVAGYYQINGMAQLNSTTIAYGIALWKNGSQISQAAGVGVSGLNGTANTSAVVSLNGSTDYVELYMYQTSGGTLTAAGNSGVTGLSGAMIRSA